MPSVTTAPGDFARLVEQLYGDLVDVDTLWEVSKMGPDVSSVHTTGYLQPMPLRRKRRVRKDDTTGSKVANSIGLGATAIGTGYGVRELAEKLPEALPKTAPAVNAVTGAARKLTPKLLKTALGKPKVSAGLAAGLLAGDATATAVLGRKHGEVGKGIVPELADLRAGKLSSLTDTLKTIADKTHAAAAPVVPPVSKPKATMLQAVKQGQAVRQGIGDMLKVPGAKPVTGAVVGGAYLKGRSSGRDAATPDYDTYGKSAGEVTFGGSFSKFDNDKRQAFGWASVVEVNGEPVVDRQGDYIGIDDIESAAYVYVRKSRVAGDMHRRTETDEPFKAGELIESVVFTKDKCEAMGLPMSCAGKWWIGVQVDDEDTWSEVKKQARTGFSIHGKGLRKDADYDSLLST